MGADESRVIIDSDECDVRRSGQQRNDSRGVGSGQRAVFDEGGEPRERLPAADLVVGRPDALG